MTSSLTQSTILSTTCIGWSSTSLYWQPHIWQKPPPTKTWSSLKSWAHSSKETCSRWLGRDYLTRIVIQQTSWDKPTFTIAQVGQGCGWAITQASMVSQLQAWMNSSYVGSLRLMERLVSTLEWSMRTHRPIRWGSSTTITSKVRDARSWCHSILHTAPL